MDLDARQEAERLLGIWWDHAGVDVLPVDPVPVANELGIQVRQADLEKDVSGAIFRDSGDDPYILLNGNDHPNRKRFTCAHEIGHWVERTLSDPTAAIEFVDFRNTLSATGTDAREVFANRFAAELLMPERLIRKWLDNGERVLELARRFGVSPEAMGHRLNSLGLR